MKGHAVALYKRTRFLGWQCLEAEHCIHVVPGWQDHDLSVACGCGPSVERTYERVMYVHNEEPQ